ncbi:MAG TPA: glutathione S-transferase family protein [Polyangiaceae bacterium]|nr:glutathione S-transferase family protein [Polyangiaceae bacterium]
MILIGQYDSPYVRRVGITLRLYGMPYEHRNWSVWRDAEQIATYNPLRRVPTLVLDDQSVLVDSFVILDALDELMGRKRALLPAEGPLRREGLRISALCTGMADKAVSLMYETLFRPNPSQVWMERCRRQIQDTAELLERDRAARHTPHWLGDALSHADVALACGYRFVSEAHPGLLEPEKLPALAAQTARCEALPEFQAVYQPIINNIS